MQALVAQTMPASGFAGAGHWGRISCDARDTQLGQQRIDIVREPAGVPRLADDAAAMNVSEGPQEPSARIWVEAEARRQLDQERAKLGAEPGDLAEELAQQPLGSIEPLLVRDRARKLDGEAKPFGHGRRPSRIGPDSVGPVERSVDLHGIEALRVAFQMAAGCGERIGMGLRHAPAGRPNRDHAVRAPNVEERLGQGARAPEAAQAGASRNDGAMNRVRPWNIGRPCQS